MEKQIPIYFDSIVISSPTQGISESNPNIGRLKVRVFTKYKNRNGSYITEAVAQQLIDSATNGMTPVVGFFDPSTETWASHSGPTLANAYGYVESFLGWEPFTDTDGVSRDYAVFSVVLFTDYFNEAQKILGQNQSMELDVNSITGDWTMIEGEECFVYKTAKMAGFCVIGEHEPCFSVSAFFEKKNDMSSESPELSSLLFELKTRVDELEQELKGGEQPMNEFEQQEVVEDTVAPEVEENVEVAKFEAQEAEEQESEVVVTEDNEPAAEENFELVSLRQQYNELETSYNELQANYEAAQTRIAELDSFQTTANEELETLRTQNAELQASLQAYEAAAINAENEKKTELVKKYEKILSEEEIAPVKVQVNDFSYDELESKLAVIFAHKQMNKESEEDNNKVPVLEPEESQFALLMKKYRKN